MDNDKAINSSAITTEVLHTSGYKKQTAVVHLSLLYLWTHEERMGGGWKESVVLTDILKVSSAFYQQLLIGLGSHLICKEHKHQIILPCRVLVVIPKC